MRSFPTVSKRPRDGEPKRSITAPEPWRSMRRPRATRATGSPWREVATFRGKAGSESSAPVPETSTE